MQEQKFNVLKVSRPTWLKGWKAAPVHLGKDPKGGRGDDVFVAMKLHVLHMAACVFTT